MRFTRGMNVGWNLGNTFDAYDDGFRGNPLDLEKHWVGVRTSEALIDTLCSAGFNVIRIPVSWHNHVNEEFVIDEAWLNRVQEVVDYAYSRGMYVILNTHHDVSAGYYYPDKAHLEISKKYISTIWTQLSGRFAGYGEKLIFESMNEPRAVGTSYEWNYDASNPACVESLECINVLNQLFVDTVRASGGNNVQRYLMIPSYDAAPAPAVSDCFRLPQDSAENKLIISVHAYTPYPFALDANGTRDYSMALNGPQAKEIVLFMNSLYDKYITNGIPVIIGEFGARDKNGNTQARVDFAAQYAALASARNIPCVWWDNHAFKGNGELFGLIDRRSCTWKQPEIMQALVRYGGYDKLQDPD